MCALPPKGKNASECRGKGQGLIEHQMVTGFRYSDYRNVASTQFADVVGRVLCEELAVAAVHDSLATRRFYQAFTDGDYALLHDQVLYERLWRALEDAAATLDFERAARLRRDLLQVNGDNEYKV